MQNETHTSLYETLTLDIGLSEHEIMREFPASIADIARAIGVSLTVALIEEFGGKQIYVPGVVKDGARLPSVIGIEAAQKVTELLGGVRHVAIPQTFGARTMLRLRGHKALRNGASLNQIAHSVGVSRRTIQGWRGHVGLKGEGKLRQKGEA